VYHEGFERVSDGSARRTSGEKPSVAFADEIFLSGSVAASVVARNGREV
jgi:hypothetical protein